MLWFLLFKLCYSNNVDVESPLVLKGSQVSSLFGYSVLIHQLPDSSHVFLVGAPKANTSQNLTSPGAVYKCAALTDDLKHVVSCDEWLDVFDSTDDNAIRLPTGDLDTFVGTIETKSEQFFGVSLIRTNESVIGCANLYKDHYGIKKYLVEKRLPIGRCSAISLDLDKHRGFLHPCKEITDSHDSYGSCNSGASIAYHDGKVQISAPNANHAYGNSFLYQDGVDTPPSQILEAMSSSWLGSLENTGDQIPSDYAGYSSVFCDVNGDGTKELILGMPRAYNYRGSIRIHFGSKEEELKLIHLISDFVTPSVDPLDVIGGTIDTQVYKNLKILCPAQDQMCTVPEGPHMGSYYGHSLACADLNGDGLDDLVVGAPYFSEYIQTNVINDVGKVMIIYGNSRGAQWMYPFPDFDEKLKDELVGDLADSGLFGYSLNAEGDLNSDGVADLVVGAPYADEGQGAVYIFNGGKGFFDTRHSQKITPVQLRENLRGFGSDISSGFDIDDTAGHDLLIGSYLSDAAISLRTIPTVNIIPTLLLMHDVVNLEDPTFTDPQTGEKTVGNTLRIKIDTTGIQFPNENIQLNWKLVLDPYYSDPVDKRAYIREDEIVYEIQGAVLLQSNKVEILPDIVTILLKRNTIRNTKELYIDIEGALEAVKSREYFSSKFALKYELFREASIPIKIATNCSAETSVCTSDVQISRLDVSIGAEDHGITSQGNPILVINHIETVSVFVTLTNRGPDKAYDTVFTLRVPQQLHFYSITTHSFVECDKNLIDDIECRVQGPMGGPFPVDVQDIRIEFIVSNNENFTNFEHNRFYDISASVKVGIPSLDPNFVDNHRVTSLHALHLADITLDGGSRQPTQFFTNHLFPDFQGPESWEDIGPEVRHSVVVAVDELIDVESVTDLVLEVRWPLKRDNKYFLYITEIHIPEDYIGMVSCESALVDQLNLAPAKPVIRKASPETPTAVSPGDHSPGDPPTGEASSRESAESNISEEKLFGMGEDASLDCTTNACHVIKCRVPALHRGIQSRNKVKLEVRSRLWERTFTSNYRVNATSFSKVVSVGGDLVLPSSGLISKQITSKFVLPSKRKGLNLWVILLSAAVALVILAIVILILWKRGFFKSSRFSRSPQNFYQTGSRRQTFDRNMFTAS